LTWLSGLAHAATHAAAGSGHAAALPWLAHTAATAAWHALAAALSALTGPLLRTQIDETSVHFARARILLFAGATGNSRQS
jgi:hypothetical protein